MSRISFTTATCNTETQQVVPLEMQSRQPALDGHAEDTEESSFQCLILKQRHRVTTFWIQAFFDLSLRTLPLLSLPVNYSGLRAHTWTHPCCFLGKISIPPKYEMYIHVDCQHQASIDMTD